MTPRPLCVAGAYVLEPAAMTDDRGTFVELFAQRDLAALGWTSPIVRSATSYNLHRATLRGLHFQRSPFQDAKLVTCVRGAVFDVVADVRIGSPTRGSWDAVELTEKNQRVLVLPGGVAHGFETLVDHSSVLYHFSEYYVAESGAGVCWNDPALAIRWPFPPEVISDEDRHWGAFLP